MTYGNANFMSQPVVPPWQVAAPAAQPLFGGTDYASSMTPSLAGVDMGAVGGAMPMSLWEQFKATMGNMPLATSTDAKGIKTQGMFDMGLGAAQGLMGSYLGFQNLGVAKKTLAQNERQFDLNFGAQQKTTNARMADRQASRVAWDRNAIPVADYMAKNGI